MRNLANSAQLVEPDGKRMADALDFFCVAARAGTERRLREAFDDTIECLGIDFFQLLRIDVGVSIVWSKPVSFRPPPVFSHETDHGSSLGASRSRVGQLEIWPDGYLQNALEGLDPTTDQWLSEAYSNGMRSGATISLIYPDQSRDIFRFGARKDILLATHAGDIGLCSTIAAFAARQVRVLSDRKLRNSITEPSLSARELEILRWSKDGKSYPEIAAILGISAKTIEFHMANAMRKLGVNQKVSAIIAAMRLGMIEL